MAQVELTYHGPDVRVIELDRTLSDGETVKVDEALAGRLLCAAGFDGPEHLKPPEAPPSDVHGPQNPHPEGLYPDDDGFEEPKVAEAPDAEAAEETQVEPDADEPKRRRG